MSDDVSTEPLRRPRLPGRLVTRHRLQGRLDRLAPVTSIKGLPGTGKTTLLSQWAHAIESRGDSVVWVSCQAVDRGRLFESLESSLRRREADDPTGTAIPRTVLILDDAHTLTESDLDGVSEMLRRRDDVHLAFSSIPGRVLFAQLAEQRIETTRLRTKDLAVSPEELPEFARAWGHPTSRARARQVHAAVDGWMLPSRLVLDETPARAHEPSLGEAREFVDSRVLAETIGTRDGLAAAVALATPPAITTELARAVLSAIHVDAGGHDAPLAIDGLFRAGLLHKDPRPRPSVQQSWRFSRLVRAVLIDKADEVLGAAGRRAVHRIVAQSMAEPLDGTRPSLASALHHARDAEDWNLLSLLWRTHGLRLMTDCRDAATRAYGDLPEAVLNGNPLLSIAAAVAVGHATAGDSGSGSGTLVRRYAQSGRGFDVSSGGGPVGDQMVRAATAQTVALRMEGRLSEAVDLAESFTDRLADPRRQQPRLPVGDLSRAWFEMQRGMTHVLAGQLDSSIRISMAAYDVAAPIAQADYIASNAAAHVALARVVLGETAGAEKWLGIHQACEIEDDWVGRIVSLPAHVTRVILAADRMDEKAATTLWPVVDSYSRDVEMLPFMVLAQTECALSFGDPARTLLDVEDLRSLHGAAPQRDVRPHPLVDRCAMRLMVASGELNRAHARLVAGERNRPDRVLEAQIHLAARQHDKALHLAKAGARIPSTSLRDRVEFLMIQATCLLRTGLPREAGHAFQLAHGSIASSGLVSMYTRIDADTRDELQSITGAELPVSVREAVDGRPRPYPDDADLVLLTPRELAVLRQTAETESVAAVAEALQVSVNTVKKQRVAVYAKLGVNDPQAAVMRAQRLGILDAPDAHW